MTKAAPPPTSAFDAPAAVTLAAALRARLPDRSWNDVRRLCETGKVTVGGVLARDPAVRLRGGERIELRMRARKPPAALAPGFSLVFEDAHLVVIDKPHGVMSVPFDREDTGTAMDLVRSAWRQDRRRTSTTPLYIVHRLDKETSGLLCFAKTRVAERGLHTVFQKHLSDRTYFACVHGQMTSCRIETRLVPDRGDGLRGSVGTKNPVAVSQRAVTHVTAIRRARLATFCQVQLETGRTHQIRIHVAERGHPVVGDPVYVRDFLRAGKTPLGAGRMLLHAATLGFAHPVSGERLSFSSVLPTDFVRDAQRLEVIAPGDPGTR